MKYDNCKDCHSKCEHAGKDREFICPKGVSCKISKENIELVEVVHGRWGYNGIPESMLSKCSVCGYSCGASTFNYCPNCGAKMDGDGNG